MPALPARLRKLAPDRLRDDVRVRAVGVGMGLMPSRGMHSSEDAHVLLGAVQGARRVVEIGVYEGSSALVLHGALGPSAELHLIDPFGRHPDALPSGWGATEWATRRVLGRAVRSRGAGSPKVFWHIEESHEVALRWSAEVDVVFIDGDHSEAGCETDWSDWHRFVAVGGHVVFHDARADRPDGRGLPGPTAVVTRHFRGGDDAAGRARSTGWEIAAEADRTVAVRRLS